MKRKLIAFGLTAALALGSLTACGGGTGGTGGTGGDTGTGGTGGTGGDTGTGGAATETATAEGGAAP